MKSQNLVLWLSIALANAIVLYVASMVVPASVVLGNNAVSNWLAAILTALILTAALYGIKPVLKAVNLQVKGDLSINITYFVTNMAGLWVLGRLANYTGFGVSSFVVVIVLGFVLNLVQYFVWKKMAGAGKK